MFGSRVAATLWRGGYSGASAWPPFLCPAFCWMRQKTGKSGNITAYTSQGTYASCLCMPPQGSYPESSECNTLHPCSPHACSGFSLYPNPKGPESESHPSVPSLSPYPADCWMGLDWSTRPSRSAQRNLVWWRDFCACGWVWGTLCPGLQHHHVTRYEKMWWGRPSYSQGSAWCWIWPHSHGIRVLCRIEVIWHHCIPGPQAPIRSPCMEKWRATPPSYFRGGGGGFMSVRFFPLWHRNTPPPPSPSSVWSLFCHQSGVVCGPQSVTRRGPI